MESEKVCGCPQCKPVGGSCINNPGGDLTSSREHDNGPTAHALPKPRATAKPESGAATSAAIRSEKRWFDRALDLGKIAVGIAHIITLIWR